MSIEVISNATTVKANEAMASANEKPASEAKDTKQAALESEVSDETKDDSGASDESEAEELEAKEADGDEADDKNEQGDKPKRKSGWQRKVDKLTKRAADAQREAQYWREQALRDAQREQPKNQTQEEPKQNASAQDGKPNANDFESYEDYIEAVADWKFENRLKAKEAQEREAKLREEISTKERSYLEKVQEFQKTHADWNDLIEEIGDIPMSVTVQEMLLKHGPELTYEVIKDRDYYERLQRMHALDAAEELGAIVYRLKQAKNASGSSEEKKELKKTKAPEPITPVGRGAAGVKKTIFDPTLTQAEYERLRREQMRANRA